MRGAIIQNLVAPVARRPGDRICAPLVLSASVTDVLCNSAVSKPRVAYSVDELRMWENVKVFET
jgi:hypothetical protein